MRRSGNGETLFVDCALIYPFQNVASDKQLLVNILCMLVGRANSLAKVAKGFEVRQVPERTASKQPLL